MTAYYCPEHKTTWFKKGKMQSFAHPIKDYQGNTTGWCSMIKPAPAQAPTGQSQENAEPEVAKANEEQMSKDEWAEKDRVKRTSIHRQSASQRGVELVLGEVITFNQMIPWIRAFETYYNTDEWPVRPLTGYEALAKSPSASPSATTPPAAPPSAFPMCSIKGHESMPLDKKTKDGTPAHEFTDAQGARHKCIPKIDPALCVKHNVSMRQDAQGNYYHAVDEDSPNTEICKGK